MRLVVTLVLLPLGWFLANEARRDDTAPPPTGPAQAAAQWRAAVATGDAAVIEAALRD